MLTPDLYCEVRARLAAMGHVGDWEWAQSVRQPEHPEALACEYTWVVLNSGMKSTIARKIFDRVWPLLSTDQKIGAAFGHKGKVAVIEDMWDRRESRFLEFLEADAMAPADPHVAEEATELAHALTVLDWCESLPWIGGITKYHLAKNLGVDCAKPDRWLVRLAEAEGTTAASLCRRLAHATGDRIASVDVVLWRACAVGLLVVDGDGIRLVPP